MSESVPLDVLDTFADKYDDLVLVDNDWCCRGCAEVGLAAVIPIIEARLRAKLAAEIRASINERGYFYADEMGQAQCDADTAAREDAARIVEGIET